MSEGYIDKDWCSFESYRQQRLIFYLLTIIGVMSISFILPLSNTLAVNSLMELVPSISPPIHSNVWAGAILEEVSVRFVPALGILLIFSAFIKRKCYNITEEAFRLGAVGAFTMGVTELYIRTMDPGGPFFGPPGSWMIAVWNHPAYYPGQLAPLVMHMFAGTVNIGVFFRVFGDFDIESRDIVAYLGALLIAIAIHFVFNTWVQEQGMFWRQWSRTLGTPVTLLVLLALAIIGADVLDEYVKNREVRT